MKLYGVLERGGYNYTAFNLALPARRVHRVSLSGSSVAAHLIGRHSGTLVGFSVRGGGG